MCVFDSDEMLIPKTIGLGFFHQKVNSVTRQAEKEKALTDALKEIPSGEAGLLDEVDKLLDSFKKFYDAPNVDFSDFWAKVFARDACYIIQFFSARKYEDYLESELTADIFIPSNQIPLVLLVKIMKICREPDVKITKFIEGLARYKPFQTLCPLVVSRKDYILNLKAEFDLEDSELCQHLLHLLHKSIADILQVPNVSHVMGGLIPPPARLIRPPLLVATDVFKTLEECNITFRERIGEVCFDKGYIFASILYLPSISLEGDRTVKFYKSLMAFDWISSDCNPICDLTFLLHLIVDDSNRKLFSKAGIIQGGGERFCTKLNNIVRDLIEFYIGDEGYHGGVYRSVIDQLYQHTRARRNEWMYRAHDWVILLGLLALFAAIFFGVVNEIRK